MEVLEADDLPETGHFFKFVGPVRVSPEEDCLGTDATFSSSNIAISNAYGLCVFSDSLGLYVFELSKLRSLAASNKNKPADQLPLSSSDCIFSAAVPGIKRVVLSQDEQVVALLRDDNTLEFASMAELLTQRCFVTLEALKDEADGPLSDFQWLPPYPSSTIPSYLLLTQSRTLLPKTLGSSQAAKPLATNVSAFCASRNASTMNDVCIVVAETHEDKALPSVVFLKTDGTELARAAVSELPFLDLDEGDRGVIDTLQWLGPNTILVSATKCDMASWEETGDASWQGILSWPEGQPYPMSADDCTLHEFFAANTEPSVTESLSGPYCNTAVLPMLGCAITAHRKAADDHIRVFAFEPQIAMLDISEDKLAVRIPNAMDDNDNFVVGLGVDLTDPEPVPDPLDATKPDVTQCASLVVATSNGSLLLYRFGQIGHAPDLQLVTNSQPFPTTKPAWLQQLGTEPAAGLPARGVMDPAALRQGVMAALPSDEEDDADSGVAHDDEDRVAAGIKPPGTLQFQASSTNPFSPAKVQMPAQPPAVASIPASAALPFFPPPAPPESPSESASESYTSDESSTGGTSEVPLPYQGSSSPVRPFPKAAIEQAASSFNPSAHIPPASAAPFTAFASTPGSTSTTFGAFPSFPAASAPFQGFGGSFGLPASSAAVASSPLASFAMPSTTLAASASSPRVSFTMPSTAATAVTTSLPGAAAPTSATAQISFGATGVSSNSFTTGAQSGFGSPSVVPTSSPNPFTAGTSFQAASSLSQAFGQANTKAAFGSSTFAPDVSKPASSAFPSRAVTSGAQTSFAPFAPGSAPMGALPGSTGPSWGSVVSSGPPPTVPVNPFAPAAAAQPAGTAAPSAASFAARKAAPTAQPTRGTSPRPAHPKLSITPSAVEAPKARLAGLGDPIASTEADFLKKTLYTVRRLAATTDAYFKASDKTRTELTTKLSNRTQQLQKLVQALNAQVLKSLDENKELSSDLVRASRGLHQLKTFRPYSSYQQTKDLNLPLEPELESKMNTCKALLEKVKTQLWDLEEFADKAAAAAAASREAASSAGSTPRATGLGRGVKTVAGNRYYTPGGRGNAGPASRAAQYNQQYSALTLYTTVNSASLSTMQLLEEIERLAEKMDELDIPVGESDLHFELEGLSGIKIDDSHPTPRSTMRAPFRHSTSSNIPATPKLKLQFATPLQSPMNTPSTTDAGRLTKRRMQSVNSAARTPSSSAPLHSASTAPNTSAGSLPRPANLACHPLTPLLVKSTRTSQGRVRMKVADNPLHLIASRQFEAAPAPAAPSVKAPSQVFGIRTTNPGASPAGAAFGTSGTNTSAAFPTAEELTQLSRLRAAYETDLRTRRRAEQGAPNLQRQSAGAPAGSSDARSTSSITSKPLQNALSEEASTATSPQRGATKIRSKRTAHPGSFDDNEAADDGAARAQPSLQLSFGGAPAFSLTSPAPTASAGPVATSFASFFGTPSSSGFAAPNATTWLTGSNSSASTGFGAQSQGQPASWVVETKSSTPDQDGGTSAGAVKKTAENPFSMQPPSRGAAAAAAAAAASARAEASALKQQYQSSSESSEQGPAKRSSQPPVPSFADLTKAAQLQARASQAAAQPPVQDMSAKQPAPQTQAKVASKAGQPPVPDMAAILQAQQLQATAKKASQPPIPDMASRERAQQLQAQAVKPAAQPPVPDMAGMAKAKELASKAPQKAAQPPIPDMAGMAKAQELASKAPLKAAQPPVPDMASIAQAQQLRAQVTKATAAQPPVPDASLTAAAQQLTLGQGSKNSASSVPTASAPPDAPRAPGSQPPMPSMADILAAQSLKAPTALASDGAQPAAGSQPPVPDMSAVLAAQKSSPTGASQTSSNVFGASTGPKHPQATSSTTTTATPASGPFSSAPFAAFGSTTGAFSFSKPPTSDSASTASAPVSQPQSSSPLPDSTPTTVTSASPPTLSSPFGAFGTMSSLSLSTTTSPAVSSAPTGKPGPFGQVSSMPAFAALGSTSAQTSSAFGFPNTAASASKEIPLATSLSFQLPSSSTPPAPAFGLAATAATSSPSLSTTITPTAISAFNITAPVSSAFGSQPAASSSPFGALSSTSASSSAFGVTTSSPAASSPFGMTTSSTAAPSPFGVTTSSAAAPSPFGVTTSSPAAASPFGAPSSAPAVSSPFSVSAPPTPSNPFGSSAASSTAFGAGALGSSLGSMDLGGQGSTFGGASQPAAARGLFGGGSGAFNAFTTTAPAQASSSAFGASTGAPFASAFSAPAFGSSPFGASSSSSSPFGVSSSSSTSPVPAAPFGQSASLGGSSPFGGGGVFGTSAPAASAASVFGSTATPGAFGPPAASNPAGIPGFGQSAAFGTATAGSAFGGGSTAGNAFAAFAASSGSGGFAAAAKAGPGFGAGVSAFGGAATTAAPFGGAPGGSPFGGAPAAAPFGAMGGNMFANLGASGNRPANSNPGLWAPRK